jgi:hypothetical protein
MTPDARKKKRLALESAGAAITREGMPITIGEEGKVTQGAQAAVLLTRCRDAGAAMKRLACFTRSGAGHIAGQR